MDIKQLPSARACLTIGKDMTWRDYAQGAYRMRGIGKGQTIHLYIIPEVANRITADLEGHVSDNAGWRLLVPAWLLVNSMRMEAMQFSMLSLQEVDNLFRKKALPMLQQWFDAGCPQHEAIHRLLNDKEAMQICREAVHQFETEVNHEVNPDVPKSATLTEMISKMVDHARKQLLGGSSIDSETEVLIQTVIKRHACTSESSQGEVLNTAASLDSEREQEQEQEQEQQRHQEQQKHQEQMSQYSRENEDAKPWAPSELWKSPVLPPNGTPFEELILNYPFYPLNRLVLSDTMDPLHFPNALMVSDNFFRPVWLGGGPRRLKNVSVVLEWSTEQDERQAAAITLAEAESIRWMLHKKHGSILKLQLALRTLGGSIIDATSRFLERRSWIIQGFRFFHGEMYYTPEQMTGLLEMLALDKPNVRAEFFTECMLVRRRERHKWIDTPVAKLFFEEVDWSKIHELAVVEAVKTKLLSRRDVTNVESAFKHWDTNKNGALDRFELNGMMKELGLGLSTSDISRVMALARTNEMNQMPLQEFQRLFELPDCWAQEESRDEEIERLLGPFDCTVCHYKNTLEGLLHCGSCGAHRPNYDSVPPEIRDMIILEFGQWQCEYCTFINVSVKNKFCECCRMARKGACL